MNTNNHFFSGADSIEFISYYMDCMDTRAVKLKRIATKLKEACDALHTAAKLLTTDIEMFGSDTLSESSLRASESEIEKFEQTVMRLCNAIYHIISPPVSSYNLRNYDTAYSEDARRFGREALGVTATLHDDKILVTLPMLGRKIPYPSHGKTGKPFTYNSSKIFAADVERSVSLAIKQMDKSIYEKFLYKTLSFFFVYPQNASAILDSDSHDTKAIIDAIAIQLPGGDGAVFCSDSFSTEITDAYPEGTYICVSPGKYTFQSSEILNFFPRVTPQIHH